MNDLDLQKLNFIKSAPETKWLMTARNPVENCESWISEPSL